MRLIPWEQKEAVILKCLQVLEKGIFLLPKDNRKGDGVQNRNSFVPMETCLTTLF